MQERLLLSVEQVAQILGLSRHTVYQWAAAGRIPLVKLGTRTLFHPEEIKRWVAKNSRAQVHPRPSSRRRRK